MTVHDSVWTMQEIGYALGKGIPCVSLKLGHRDPPGFRSHTQALKGALETASQSASRLFPLIAQALGRRERLQTALVTSFVESPSWSDTTRRFDLMNKAVEKLTDDELALIIRGFYKNDQLHSAAYLYYRNHQRMIRFLQGATGKEFEVLAGGRTIRERPDL